MEENFLQFKKGDICEIVDIEKGDHYFDRKQHLIGRAVRIICQVPQMSIHDNGLFSGWVEALEDIPGLKLKEKGFLSLTHAVLKKF